MYKRRVKVVLTMPEVEKIEGEVYFVGHLPNSREVFKVVSSIAVYMLILQLVGLTPLNVLCVAALGLIKLSGRLFK